MKTRLKLEEIKRLYRSHFLVYLASFWCMWCIYLSYTSTRLLLRLSIRIRWTFMILRIVIWLFQLALVDMYIFKVFFTPSLLHWEEETLAALRERSRRWRPRVLLDKRPQQVQPRHALNHMGLCHSGTWDDNFLDLQQPAVQLFQIYHKTRAPLIMLTKPSTSLWCAASTGSLLTSSCPWNSFILKYNYWFI